MKGGGDEGMGREGEAGGEVLQHFLPRLALATPVDGFGCKPLGFYLVVE